MPDDDPDLGAQLQQIMATLMLQGAMQSALTDELIERKILLPAQVHAIYARALSDLRAAREVGIGVAAGTVDIAIAQLERLAENPPAE
jgi:hypothetical protein